MSGARRATTVFWSAMLIAIGALLLAKNFGLSIPVWSALAVYWPVILILWGSVKLIDRLRFSGALSRRHLFSAGEVVLIVNILLVGSAISAFAHFGPKLSEVFRTGVFRDVLALAGNHYSYAEHKEVLAPPGSVIDILNMYGDVDIRSAPGNRVVVDVQKTLYALDKDEGDRMAADFAFSITNEPGTKEQGAVIRIRSSRDGNAGPDVGPLPFVSRQRYKSSLTIQVPSQASVRLTNHNGSVTIAQLTGDQEIHNSFGSVTVTAITGRVEVSNRNGDISLETISAGAAVTNNLGSIRARNIRGALEIKGAHSDVDVDTLEGAATIATSFNDLRIRNARSAIDLKNRHGAIDIDLDEPPGGDVRVEAEFADVTLRLPEASNFSLDAHARFGSLESDFEGPDNVISSRERRASGMVGTGGPRITINTRGRIRLIKT